MMSNLVATATDEEWTYDQLMANTICQFCNKNHYNLWYSCNRRASMVNLHPGLSHINRQHWYLIKIVAKYAIDPYNSKISFLGHPNAKTTQRSYTIPDVSLPKDLQTHIFVSHGKNDSYFVWFQSDYFLFSGNECLVGADGFGLGTHLSLNSGCMSHGNIGGSTGLSKALVMSLVLFIKPLKEDQQMDFSKAWYPMDVCNIKPLHLDLLHYLSLGADRHFWVSLFRVGLSGLGKGKL